MKKHQKNHFWNFALFTRFNLAISIIHMLWIVFNIPKVSNLWCGCVRYYHNLSRTTFISNVRNEPTRGMPSVVLMFYFNVCVVGAWARKENVESVKSNFKHYIFIFIIVKDHTPTKCGDGPALGPWSLFFPSLFT